MRLGILAIVLIGFVGCGGVSGETPQAESDWIAVNFPEGCKVKQLAGVEGLGIILLCEDGRVFRERFIY